MPCKGYNYSVGLGVDEEGVGVLVGPEMEVLVAELIGGLGYDMCAAVA